MQMFPAATAATLVAPDERCCIHQAGWFEKSQGPSFLWVFSTVTSMIYWVIFSGVLAGEKRRVTLIWIMSPRHQAPTATFSLLSINNAQLLTLRSFPLPSPLPFSYSPFAIDFFSFFSFAQVFISSHLNVIRAMWSDFSCESQTLPAVCTFVIPRSRIKASGPIYLVPQPDYPSRSRLVREHVRDARRFAIWHCAMILRAGKSFPVQWIL